MTATPPDDVTPREAGDGADGATGGSGGTETGLTDAEAQAAVHRLMLWADLLDDDMRSIGYPDGHTSAKAVRELIAGTRKP